MILTTRRQVPLLRRGLRCDPQESKSKKKAKKRYGPRMKTSRVGDIVLAHCSARGSAASPGLVWMIQGKPKGIKMFGCRSCAGRFVLIGRCHRHRSIKGVLREALPGLLRESRIAGPRISRGSSPVIARAHGT